MLRDEFRKYGFTARRTQQYCGNTGDASDVIVEELPWLHLECKNTEKKDFLNWWAQATRDAGASDKIPVVAHKRNREPWMVFMPLDFFLNLLSVYERP
jgi:hypothetical protein